MADNTLNEEISMVEIPTTTLMKIVKHCRENGNDEAMGVIMGTIEEDTCFVGNSFPFHSKKSIMRHAQTEVKAKTTVIDKAVEYFENTNYDNTVVGVYINVPSGKFFSTNFIHEILSASNQDMLNDSKIWIAYERTLAELGMNPFTAFKFTDSFIENIKNKKIDELLKDKISIDELKIKIFRSSYDQAFLSEYVCPNLSEYSGKIYDDLSIADICWNFMTLLETEIDDHIYITKNNEHEVKKAAKANKRGKTEETADINKVDYLQSLQTIDQLNDRIKEVIEINH